MRGELVTLLGWLAPVPDEAIDARPWLAIYHAWALLLTGQTDAVEPRLQAAERSEIKERRSEMLGHATAIRAYLAALQRDVPHAIELAQEALALLPKDELVVRGVVSFTLGGACLMHGDASGASQAFAKAGAIGQAAGNIHLAVPAMSRLAELKIEQGHLHQAAQVLQQAMDLVTRPDGRPLPVAAQPHSGMGDLLYEWNDLDAALQHLRKSVELGRQWGNADALAADYCGLARVHQAQGPAEQALDALQEAEQLVREREPSPLMVAQVAAHRARLMLSQGDLTAATRWAASREAELCADEEPEYMREFEYLTLVRILIARGRYDEALNMLERLLETAERGGRMGRAIGILVLQALAFQALGRNDQAAAMLERALSLAEPEGYVRTFLDEGEPMVELLRRAAAQGIAVEYARKLLIAFDAWEIERVREDRPAAHTPALVEPLSDRELEVLRLVAAGLTNREIAKELVIAVSTVKSHTNHIYGKLGVKNRTQAVAQARALGLF
jgi:LuxR family maltose regulon positive regulatory protein